MNMNTSTPYVIETHELSKTYKKVEPLLYRDRAVALQP